MQINLAKPLLNDTIDQTVVKILNKQSWKAKVEQKTQLKLTTCKKIKK